MGKASYRQHSVTELQHNLGQSVLRENKQNLRAVEHGASQGSIHYGKQHAETEAIYAEHVQAREQAKDAPQRSEQSVEKPRLRSSTPWSRRWAPWKSLGREVGDGWEKVLASARMFREGTAQLAGAPRKGVKLLARQLFG